MDLGIAGRWALVCGASKGRGHGCAEALGVPKNHLTLRKNRGGLCIV